MAHILAAYGAFIKVRNAENYLRVRLKLESIDLKLAVIGVSGNTK